jgi:hypothetical protein
VVRFDGAYTRFILMDGWGLGAIGYRAPGGALTGIALVGYRTAIPFREVPGLEYWDCNGPTLSLNLVFGVF